MPFDRDTSALENIFQRRVGAQRGLSLKKWRAIAMISIGRQQWWTNKDGLRMILSARQFV
jgi:hypothetical protein